MKLLSLLILVIGGYSYSDAQIYNLFNADIKFETNADLIEFDTSQINNIWQIGAPEKTILNEAYSAPFVIITDTVSSYPVNNKSSFQVTIIPDSEGYNCWGMGYMQFKHKYDFEANKDGGFIEYRYDNDTTWTNIIYDEDPELGMSFNYFYTENDTITGGIPAFTGTSDEWRSCQIEWIWQMGVKSWEHDSLTIRFTMISDSVESNQEGWMIDNLYINIDECTGGFEEIESSNSSFVYPNPVTDNFQIKFSNTQNKESNIRIYDFEGKEVKNINTNTNSISINGADIQPGIYTYTITGDNEIIGKGKFVKID